MPVIHQAMQLCERLLRPARVALLRWELSDLEERMGRKTHEINEATDKVVELARFHRVDPVLNAHRKALREEHDDLSTRWTDTQRKLDTLQAINGGAQT